LQSSDDPAVRGGEFRVFAHICRLSVLGRRRIRHEAANEAELHGTFKPPRFKWGRAVTARA
jgi:hypothetical protein